MYCSGPGSEAGKDERLSYERSIDLYVSYAFQYVSMKNKEKGMVLFEFIRKRTIPFSL